MRFAFLAAAVLALALQGCTLPFVPGAGDNTGPGQRAGDYLHAKPYARIVVELDSVNGSEPDGSALSLMQQRLQAATGKSVEVQRTSGVPGQGASHKYTRGELDTLEKQFRQQYSTGDHAVLYMLYLDGGFEGDGDNAKTLGAAYRGSSLVMFKGNIVAASKSSPLDLGKPTLSDVEGPVLVHETGHILGLVNLGTPMVSAHEDTSHPGHSSNQNSVMYWAVESSVIGSLLGQKPPSDFDSNDNADLQAARAR